MSFSLNGSTTSLLAEYFVSLVFVWTLFLMVRYGPRLGGSLREAGGVPILALWFFETLGWMVAILAGLVLGLVLVHIVPVFFVVGLSAWIYPCIGQAWFVGLLTLGPLFIVWLGRRPDRVLLSH